MLCINAAYAVMRRLSVCLSVTFVDCAKTNKHIIAFFHRRVATSFYIFRAKRHSNIPTGTPLTGASNASGVGRNRDSEPIYGLTVCVNTPTGQAL